MEINWLSRSWRPALGIVLCSALVGAAGCDGADDTDETAAPPEAFPVATPAPENSAEPNLTVGPDGAYLTWLERLDGAGHALSFSRWDGTRWSEPRRIIEREGLFVNWADFPSMAVRPDGTMAAHWLQRSGPGPFSYDVHVVISQDGGASWSEDVVPHRDGVQTEHGFVSMFPLADGFGAAWLDGREMPEGGPMTIRFTSIAPDGGLGEETMLDPMVCDCCQTGAAVTRDGPLVVYRGRTEDQVRDVLVTRFVDGAWTEPRTVHDDGWVIPGCPVNGPAVAADGERVVVAWFTAATDTGPGASASREDVRQMGEQGRVLAAVSHDAGATFGAPIRIDDGHAMGRVGVALLDHGEALVTWLERTDDVAEIRLRRIGREGDAGPSSSLTATAAARASGFPHVVRFQDQIVLAWTEVGDVPRVRTAVASLAADPSPVTAGGGE